MSSGLSCFWGPRLGSWSCCCQVLYWHPWLVLPLRITLLSMVYATAWDHVDICLWLSCGQGLWWCPMPMLWWRAMLMSMIPVATRDQVKVFRSLLMLEIMRMFILLESIQKPRIWAPTVCGGQGSYFCSGFDDYRHTVDKERHRKLLWQILPTP